MSSHREYLVKADINPVNPFHIPIKQFRNFLSSSFVLVFYLKTLLAFMTMRK